MANPEYTFEIDKMKTMEYGLGIDVGGTRIKYSISDRQGTIVHHHAVDTEYNNKAQFLQKLEGIVCETLQFASDRNWGIAGISVAFPGIVEHGIVTEGAGNFPGIVPLELAPFLEERFQLPAIALNDAVGMTMGEHYFGAAREVTDAIFITIGTGIGGGLLIDGQFYNGFRDRGGELGHVVIERDGLPCSCGGRGCLEVYGSTSALVLYYEDLINRKDTTIDGQLLFNKFLDDEVEAKKAFHWHFRNIAIGLGSLINIFSPQLLVLGGGIVNSGPQYLEGIKMYIDDYTMSHLRNIPIVPAELGDSAASVGGVGHLFSQVLTCP